MPRPGRAALLAVFVAWGLGGVWCSLCEAGGLVGSPASAFRAREPGPRALLVLMPTSSWPEVRSAEAANLHAFLEKGSAGLLPAAPSADADPARTLVTLGAGRNAVGLPDMPQPRAGGGGYQLSLAGLQEANDRAHTGARPGLLGDRLRELGLSTAVVSPRVDAGAAFAVLADTGGVVGGAWIGSEYRHQDAMRHALEAALSQHAAVVLDLAGEDSLAAADAILGDALEVEWLQPAFVVVVSPASPPVGRGEHRTAGWIALNEPSAGGGPGVLTSSSTRWPGLVSAADVAPTLLDWWDARDDGGAGMGGRVIEVSSPPDALAELDALDRLLTARHRLRFIAGKWYVAYGGLVFLAALALALWRPQGLKHLGAGALGVVLVPTGMLFAPAVGMDRAALHLLAAAAVTAALALGCARARRPAGALAAAMLIGSAVIVLDVLLGSPLMRRSSFGFGVIFGSRFYGIGNEYMGFVSAMMAIGLGAVLQMAPRARYAAAAVGAFLVLVIGAPWWGANWGGAFAMAAGLVALWLARRRARWWRSVAVGTGLLAASALMPAALDLLKPSAEQTHIGASAAALLAGDIELVAHTIRHKAAMNWSLLHSYWIGFVGGFLLLALLFSRLLAKGQPARLSLAPQPALSAGVVGAAAAALVALLVNDSGVVSATGGLGVAASAVIFIAGRPVEAAT